MTIILAGDIGGTKTLLRVAEKNPDGFTVLYEQRFAGADYASFSDVLGEFIETAKINLGELPILSAACFGIAGPVRDRRSQLTNLGWSFDSDRLAEEFNIAKVSLINDFVAVGYGVLGLQPHDLYTLQEGIVKARSPIGVIGAGTGLGEAYLGWNGDRYDVYATEGGHTDFAPRNNLEIELLQYLLKRHERVSVERVASGMGIVAIYQFLRDHQFAPESDEIAEKVRSWEAGDLSVNAAAAIADAALANCGVNSETNIDHVDHLATQTMQMFVEAYAAEVGNFALKLIPNGGLYIAGGIAPKILPLLQDGRFLQILKNKGRVSPVLEDIPIYIVLNPEVGLIGAMLYSASLV
ncbi:MULTISPECIES: glucokinase [Pseudanabaena]|jgi:glucokinase|uniref:glucokinase n=1 Tax=Pseudanabaena TaxID=1152 RepID=UPI002478B598|nr:MULTISPECIES: glucokinase [Pseudanabaena]MEA5487981.1 glucokinase [Pseudanabaena sp. CCNP1317]WGS70935.1 glucokinase [Pseudanabaena galeata CCNP1313]